MKKKNSITKLLLALLLTPALLNAHFVFAEEGTDTQQEQTAIDETLMADEEKIPETALNTNEENILETTPSGSVEQLLEPEANLSDSENTFTENSAADETNAEVTVIISLEDQRSDTTQNISFSGSINATQVFSLPVTVAADDIVTSSSDMAVPIIDASGQLSVQVTFPSSATGIHSLSIVISKLSHQLSGVSISSTLMILAIRSLNSIFLLLDLLAIATTRCRSQFQVIF